MTTAVILCVPPTAVQPPPAAISRRAPVPARFPQVHQEQAMPFLESTDSLPAGTRRAADRRTMRDSPGKDTLLLTSRITAPPVRPAHPVPGLAAHRPGRQAL
jgi:hypothetical protein